MSTVNYFNDSVQPRYPEWNFGPHRHDLASVYETAQTLSPITGAQVERDDDNDIVLRAEQATRVARGGVAGAGGAQGMPSDVRSQRFTHLVEADMTVTAARAFVTGWTRNTSITAQKLAEYGSINTVTPRYFDTNTIQPTSRPVYYFEVEGPGGVIYHRGRMKYGLNRAPGLSWSHFITPTNEIRLTVASLTVPGGAGGARFEMAIARYGSGSADVAVKVRICVSEADDSATTDILLVNQQLTTADTPIQIVPASGVSQATFDTYLTNNRLDIDPRSRPQPRNSFGVTDNQPLTRPRYWLQVNNGATILASAWIEGSIEFPASTDDLVFDTGQGTLTVDGFVQDIGEPDGYQNNGLYRLSWVPAASSVPVTLTIRAVVASTANDVNVQLIATAPTRGRFTVTTAGEEFFAAGTDLTNLSVRSPQGPALPLFWLEAGKIVGGVNQAVTIAGWVSGPAGGNLYLPGQRSGNFSVRWVWANHYAASTIQIIGIARDTYVNLYGVTWPEFLTPITSPDPDPEPEDPNVPLVDPTDPRNRVIPETGGLSGNSAFHNTDEARYFNTSETGWVKLEVECGETGETSSADFYLEAGIMHNLKVTRVYDTLNDTTLTPKIPANAVMAVTL